MVLDQALQASASKEKAKDRKGTLAFSKNKLNQSATMATAFLNAEEITEDRVTTLLTGEGIRALSSISVLLKFQKQLR